MNSENKIRNLLGKIFEKWRIPLPENQEKGTRLPHDFSKEIKSLLLAADIHTKVLNQAKSAMGGKPFWDGISFIHTPQNMIAIAKQLGISIQRTPQFCFVRDNFLRTKDGSIVIAHSSPHLELATTRTHSSNIYLNKTAATHTANQLFNVWSGHTKSYDASIYKEQSKFLKNPAKPLSYAYLEGGNVFILKNREEKIKALIGGDHLFQTFHQLELEGHSWEQLAKVALSNKTYEEIIEEISSSLPPDQIRMLAEEMFAQDLIQQEGKSGLISHKNQLDMMLIKFYTQAILGAQFLLIKKISIEKGAIIPFRYDEQSAEGYRSKVVEYLAKLKITKGLIAHELGFEIDDVHFIEQINYHLDLFMIPGPNHSIFLTNFALCAEMLEALGKGADDLGLSEVDRQHLERYIESAKKMDRELGCLFKGVEIQLKEAGFEVIPTPGHFIYESKTMYREFPMPSGGFNVNFMNALTGKDARTGHHYFITHGIQVGDQLGGIIMEAFSLFLKQYVPDIEVYYIGRDPANLNDFSEAMDWWNRLETQSGIHCTTFELDL